jgi:uncharacterized protein with FMN-binding domain
MTITKRTPVVLTATVAGLSATLGFHAHAPAASRATTTTQAPASSGASSTSGTSSSSSTTKTVVSEVAANQYGNVQLKVTIKNGKITAVQALEIPLNDPKSAQINAYAEPILQQSALTAQSANIDTVSGATYTSDSYKTALQSALDNANVATTGASTS